jgi:uncharacterized membrane protein YadS
MPLYFLLTGLLISFFVSESIKKKAGTLFGYLSKASVVGIAFGLHVMDFKIITPSTLGLIAFGVGITLASGYLLSRIFPITPIIAILITVGTAICGGSAIATVAPLVQAKREEIVIALGSIFGLNSAAIVIFPVVGHALGLSNSIFGMWAGIAIHDTSSVIGASTLFGDTSVKMAVIIKAIRTLFIIPVALGISIKTHRQSTQTTPPWFLLLFLAAIGMVYFFPTGEPIYHHIFAWTKRAVVIPIFLLGVSFSKCETTENWMKPLLFALGLWLIVSVSTVLCLI